MNERSTGATDSQIEAAENRCEDGGQFNAVWIRDLAEYLVPPGYAIVPVSPVRADREAVDLPTREQLADVIGNSRQYSIAVFPSSYAGPKEMAENRAIADAVLAALRATPEPERAEE